MAMQNNYRDYNKEQAERAYKLFGFRPLKGPVCPRVVAGKRCLIGYPRGERCICEARGYILDHARKWKDKNGQTVITAEPYHVDSRDLVPFLKGLHELGLCAYFTGKSLWHPTTVVIVIVKNEALITLS